MKLYEKLANKCELISGPMNRFEDPIEAYRIAKKAYEAGFMEAKKLLIIKLARIYDDDYATSLARDLGEEEA